MHQLWYLHSWQYCLWHCCYFSLWIKVAFDGVHVLLFNNVCYSPLITVVIKSWMNWSRVLGKLRVTYRVPVGTDNTGDLTISARKHIMKMENKKREWGCGLRWLGLAQDRDLGYILVKIIVSIKHHKRWRISWSVGRLKASQKELCTFETVHY